VLGASQSRSGLGPVAPSGGSWVDSFAAIDVLISRVTSFGSHNTRTFPLIFVAAQVALGFFFVLASFPQSTSWSKQSFSPLNLWPAHFCLFASYFDPVVLVSIKSSSVFLAKDLSFLLP
jgi:hypothetical protein